MRRLDAFDRQILRLVIALHERLTDQENAMSDQQAEIDQVVTDLDTIHVTIQNELDALESQILAGTPAPQLNLDALKAAVAALPVAPDNAPATAPADVPTTTDASVPTA